MSELLRCEGLSFGYDNKPFLENIGFSVNQGEMVSLIGKNGSGKSTLFKLLNGIYKQWSGSVFYKGRAIDSLSYSQRARELAVIYQNTDCSFPFSCFQVVAMGLYPHRQSLKGDNIAFIKGIMEKTDTLDFAHKPITHLSGGQKQRVIIARALAQRPKLLFMDEAMSGLDISARLDITELLYGECKRQGLTVITIQHDLNSAFEKSDKIIALREGKLYGAGKPKDLLSKELFADVFDVEAEIEDNHFRIKGRIN